MAEKTAATEEKRGTPAPASFAGLPSHPFEAFRREMERLFDSFFGDERGTPRLFPDFATPFEGFGNGFGPVRFDVAESDREVEVVAEVPGMEEKDIEVTLANGLLTLKGEKKAESEKKEKSYYLSERRFGSFQRSFRVPDTVDEEKVSASFKNGVLKVVLPKKPEAVKAAKRIAISKG